MGKEELIVGVYVDDLIITGAHARTSIASSARWGLVFE
jgi:hypothetical protein